MRDRLRNDDGLSLVELLVAMTLSVVVLGSVLLTAELMTSTTAATNRLTEAEDDARTAGNALARDVRLSGTFGATDPIATARPDDLVLRRTTPVVAGYTGPSWTRYCVVPDSGGWRLRRIAVDGPAPTDACPDLASAPAANARYDTPVRSALARSEVFTYTCAAAPCASTSLIRTVGITLAIDHPGAAQPYVTSSAVTLRNHRD